MTTATDLIGRTVYLTRGQKYKGEYLVDGIDVEEANGAVRLKARVRSELPDITGEWLTGILVPTNLVDVHFSEADARQVIRERKAAAKARREAAGPEMMPFTDGNIMAMLLGATRKRSR